MSDSVEASHITDHHFEPTGAWWTVCKHCKLAEAAHQMTTVMQVVQPIQDSFRHGERWCGGVVRQTRPDS